MPASLGRNLLRTVVLKTNSLWPFSRLNRAPYAAAIRLFVRAFRQRPEVHSIYLRSGLAGGRCTPGLSDIDLSAILRDGLSADQEYAFLESFWNTHDRLKRFFPMYGEMEILTEEEFAYWPTWSSWGPGRVNWLILHGSGVPPSDPVLSPDWRWRSLSLALWMYLDLFLPCFNLPDSYLRTQDLRRRARKTLWYVRPILHEDSQQTLPAEVSAGPLDVLADVLQALEAGVRAVASTSPSNDGTHGDGTGRCKFESARAPFQEGVRSVLRGAKNCTVVLEDGLDRSVLVRLGNSIRHPWLGTQTPPVPLPHGVFHYMIRQYSPHDYRHLLRDRIVSAGTDPLADCAPPSRQAFVRHTLDHITNVLLFARSGDLFSNAHPLDVPGLELAMRRALTARLFLADGWIAEDRPEAAARCKLAFPECHDALEEIKRDAAAGRNKKARQAAFQLVRSQWEKIRELRKRSVYARDGGGER